MPFLNESPSNFQDHLFLSASSPLNHITQLGHPTQLNCTSVLVGPERPHGRMQHTTVMEQYQVVRIGPPNALGRWGKRETRTSGKIAGLCISYDVYSKVGDVRYIWVQSPSTLGALRKRIDKEPLHATCTMQSRQRRTQLLF